MEHGHNHEADALHGGHGHHRGHGHSHGVVDPSIASTDRGLWALKWSFVGLMLTAVFQVAVVALSGSVGLLADTIHNFADAATAIPLSIVVVAGCNPFLDCVTQARVGGPNLHRHALTTEPAER